MKTAEQILIIESIAYWEHEYYEDATNKLLGDFKEVVLRAMEQYAQEAVNHTDFKQ